MHQPLAMSHTLLQSKINGIAIMDVNQATLAIITHQDTIDFSLQQGVQCMLSVVLKRLSNCQVICTYFKYKQQNLFYKRFQLSSKILQWISSSAFRLTITVYNYFGYFLISDKRRMALSFFFIFFQEYNLFLKRISKNVFCRTFLKNTNGSL